MFKKLKAWLSRSKETDFGITAYEARALVGHSSKRYNRERRLGIAHRADALRYSLEDAKGRKLTDVQKSKIKVMQEELEGLDRVQLALQMIDNGGGVD